MSAIVAKTKGLNFRFIGIDALTGEVLAEQVNFHSLLWSLRRRGYVLTMNLRRPWAAVQS